MTCDSEREDSLQRGRQRLKTGIWYQFWLVVFQKRPLETSAGIPRKDRCWTVSSHSSTGLAKIEISSR